VPLRRRPVAQLIGMQGSGVVSEPPSEGHPTLLGTLSRYGSHDEKHR